MTVKQSMSTNVVTIDDQESCRQAHGVLAGIVTAVDVATIVVSYP